MLGELLIAQLGKHGRRDFFVRGDNLPQRFRRIVHVEFVAFLEPFFEVVVVLSRDAGLVVIGHAGAFQPADEPE